MKEKSKIADEDLVLTKLKCGELAPGTKFIDTVSFQGLYDLPQLFARTNPMIARRHDEFAKACADADMLEQEVEYNHAPGWFTHKDWIDCAEEIERAQKAYHDFCNAPLVDTYANMGVDGLDELRKQAHKVDKLAGVGADGGEKVIAAIQGVAHKVDAARDELAIVGADAHAGRVAAESADAKIKSPRTDKGGNHTMRKNRKAAIVDGVKYTAKCLAGVLNRSKFQPENGARWLGACTERKIEKWDKWCADHPGEKTKRWGYCTELRTDAGRYNDLMDFIANWVGYWSDYKTTFAKWRKIHKHEPRSAFRFKRSIMRRTNIDPERIGVDEDGTKYIRPKTDAEIRREKKVAGRAHVKLYDICCP